MPKSVRKCASSAPASPANIGVNLIPAAATRPNSSRHSPMPGGWHRPSRSSGKPVDGRRAVPRRLPASGWPVLAARPHRRGRKSEATQHIPAGNSVDNHRSQHLEKDGRCRIETARATCRTNTPTTASWRWCGVSLKRRSSFTPRALVRARPSPVLTLISLRSNSARPPSIASMGRPWGVVSALNRSGFAGGSNFQIGWSPCEQDDERVFP